MDELSVLGAGLAGYPEQSNKYDNPRMVVAQAEERLKAVKEAREIFERNPDLEKLLNVMQKGLF